MVVVGVDEGDMEALKVKELRKFHHGVDVALCWIGDTYGMWLPQFCFGTHLMQICNTSLCLVRGKESIVVGGNYTRVSMGTTGVLL